jgi:hypothetical protein
MRILAISLAIIAITANVALLLGLPLLNGGDDPEVRRTDDGVKAIEGPQTLTVPPLKIGDLAKYKYNLFAQMFYENKTSGEWERYTFSGDGEFLQYIDDPVSVDDGFSLSHRSIKISYSTRASFQMKIEGSDKDPVTIPGDIEIDRNDFRNIFDEHQILATNSGSLRITGLGSGYGEIPADVSYIADMRTYPNPNDEAAYSMEDAIYAKGQVLNKYSKGQYYPPSTSDDSAWIYNWSVDGAFSVHDHDTYLVNVSTKFYDFMDYKRNLYISTDSPFYIKGHTRTNTSYYDQDESFYIVLEFTMDLLPGESNLVRGSVDIAWGDMTGDEPYVTLHPSGEFKGWDMAPQDGSDVADSTFDGWSLNKAVDYAMERSTELQSFLDEYSSKGYILISDSVYNTSQEDRLGRNTTQWWNLTFSLVASNEEVWDYYQTNDDWPQWRYRILVARSTEDRITGPQISTFISKDEGDDYHGRRDGALDDRYLGLNDEILTLSAADRILKSDPEVSSRAYDGGILKDDVPFYYGIVGVSQSTMPSLQLIEQIMGFKTPTSDNAYGLQVGSVWETGSMFGSAVDANSGQLLYVTSIEGSQLSAIFGGGT